MSEERIAAMVVDEGDGCFTLQVDSPEEVARLKKILSSPCGLRIVEGPIEELDVQETAIEELDVQMEEFVSQETEGLVCPLEPDVSWEDSVCGELEDTLTERVMARVLGGDGNG